MPAPIEVFKMFDELFTVAEIAAILKVPTSWVYERTRRRGTQQMPHFKIGKYLRFDASAVRQWVVEFREN